MALSQAYEGYEYQDLLTCYFILQEILTENNSSFLIDRKQYKADIIDDLTVTNKHGQQKKQIKYSNHDAKHSLSKKDLAADTVYNLSLDNLFQAWNEHPRKNTTDFRICLAWNRPKDELLKILQPVSGAQTFKNSHTVVYTINPDILWPDGQLPLSSWRRFRKAAETIDRSLFKTFCNRLFIEVEMPKFSLDIYDPGVLEQIVLGQARDLGIGVFPNDTFSPETFILSLAAMVRRSRSKNQIISTENIFHELKIKTDYGSIDQVFPINQLENISRRFAIDDFIAKTATGNKFMLVGEPGSGKSWFIENLQTALKKKSVRVIRHYCYTNMDDLLQRERIKLNIFYGNLIADILKEFPALKKLKKEKLASNLKELNILLANISEESYLFIDGLDHIDRIFNFRAYTDLTLNDIAIIDSISQLKISGKVKIVIGTQNITKLDSISNFAKLELPSWNHRDVVSFIRKTTLQTIPTERKLNLTELLIEKSNGNPLYLKYLVDELVKLQYINATDIAKLPAYSFNLGNYYEYLLRQLDTGQDTPRVMSGVNFSLTKNELEEITGSGNYVAQALNVLSPVLRLNLSQSGYIIYHESFRRFILEWLKANNVSIEKNVFDPVINWLETKNFYTHRKAYRYNLQLLFEAGRFKTLLSYLSHRYITESVYYGAPWDLIIRNYTFFVKAACIEKDFKNLVLLNELDKILASNKQDLVDLFPLYLHSVGKIHGFHYVSDYLVYEGSVTLSYEDGLKACYACDENNIVAPWELYMTYFDTPKDIDNDIFKYFIRGLLALRKDKRLQRVANKLKRTSHTALSSIFKDELINFRYPEYVADLAVTFPAIQSIIALDDDNSDNSPESLMAMAERIRQIESKFSNEKTIIGNFIGAIKANHDRVDLLDPIEAGFTDRNWFFNWLVYYIEIIKCHKTNPSFSKLKEIFGYLVRNTQPFFGKPAISDLYYIQPVIYQSFLDGLALVKEKEDWAAIIEILLTVSNETTISIKKSLAGPLPADVLTMLFAEVLCDNNREYITVKVAELIQEKQEYHLHSGIAEYNMRLASFYYEAGDLQQAQIHFKKGVEFILAYQMHKDLTLLDAIEGVEFFAMIDEEQALNDQIQIFTMIYSAINHTDGKETHYFPVNWFESLLKIDAKKAKLYLLNQLSSARFNWIAEKSLLILLGATKGTVNAVAEYFLLSTIPTNDSDKYISTALTVSRKLTVLKSPLAEKLMARVIPLMKYRDNRYLSPETIAQYNQQITAAGFGHDHLYLEKISKRSKYSSPKKEKVHALYDLLTMTGEDLIAHIETYGIIKKDLKQLAAVYKKFKELNESTKALTRTIVLKESRSYSEKLHIDSIFEYNSHITCYYLICRFVYDMGGHFQRFVNTDAFIKAYAIDPHASLNYFFEFMPDSLGIGTNINFSSNLIKSLVNAGYNIAVIKEMWKQLMETTNYRLPVQEPIIDEDAFANPFDLDEEELLAGMVIARFKASTSERFQWATAGTQCMFNINPQKMIGPFKWMIENYPSFQQSAFSICLEIIRAHCKIDNTFSVHFTDSLKKIFPTRYFNIDYIISELLYIDITDLLLPDKLIYPPLERDSYSYLLSLNCRYHAIAQSPVDLQYIFQKHYATFRDAYPNQVELYYSRVSKLIVPYTLPAEHIQQILNMEFYNELNMWSKWGDAIYFEQNALMDTAAICAQTNSYFLRPADLKKPSEGTHSINKSAAQYEKEWIRIGHYESQLEEVDHTHHRYSKSYGGIIFSASGKEDFPYSEYRLPPLNMWVDLIDFPITPRIVFFNLQEDPIETFRFLWLNPSIVKKLGLVVTSSEAGLVAANNQNEAVLRMETWMTDYIGDSYQEDLSSQYPKLTGTQLILRKDYFQKLSGLFRSKPFYSTYVKKGPPKKKPY